MWKQGVGIDQHVAEGRHSREQLFRGSDLSRKSDCAVGEDKRNVSVSGCV